jgi:uncharacterized protein YkwD
MAQAAQATERVFGAGLADAGTFIRGFEATVPEFASRVGRTAVESATAGSGAVAATADVARVGDITGGVRSAAQAIETPTIEGVIAKAANTNTSVASVMGAEVPRLGAPVITSDAAAAATARVTGAGTGEVSAAFSPATAAGQKVDAAALATQRAAAQAEASRIIGMSADQVAALPETQRALAQSLRDAYTHVDAIPAAQLDAITSTFFKDASAGVAGGAVRTPEQILAGVAEGKGVTGASAAGRGATQPTSDALAAIQRAANDNTAPVVSGAVREGATPAVATPEAAAAAPRAPPTAAAVQPAAPQSFADRVRSFFGIKPAEAPVATVDEAIVRAQSVHVAEGITLKPNQVEATRAALNGDHSVLITGEGKSYVATSWASAKRALVGSERPLELSVPTLEQAAKYADMADRYGPIFEAGGNKVYDLSAMNKSQGMDAVVGLIKQDNPNALYIIDRELRGFLNDRAVTDTALRTRLASTDVLIDEVDALVTDPAQAITSKLSAKAGVAGIADTGVLDIQRVMGYRAGPDGVGQYGAFANVTRATTDAEWNAVVGRVAASEKPEMLLRVDGSGLQRVELSPGAYKLFDEAGIPITKNSPNAGALKETLQAWEELQGAPNTHVIADAPSLTNPGVTERRVIPISAGQEGKVSQVPSLRTQVAVAVRSGITDPAAISDVTLVNTANVRTSIMDAYAGNIANGRTVPGMTGTTGGGGTFTKMLLGGDVKEVSAEAFNTTLAKVTPNSILPDWQAAEAAVGGAAKDTNVLLLTSDPRELASLRQAVGEGRFGGDPTKAITSDVVDGTTVGGKPYTGTVDSYVSKAGTQTDVRAVGGLDMARGTNFQGEWKNVISADMSSSDMQQAIGRVGRVDPATNTRAPGEVYLVDAPEARVNRLSDALQNPTDTRAALEMVGGERAAQLFDAARNDYAAMPLRDKIELHAQLLEVDKQGTMFGSMASLQLDGKLVSGPYESIIGDDAASPWFKDIAQGRYERVINDHSTPADFSSGPITSRSESGNRVLQNSLDASTQLSKQELVGMLSDVDAAIARGNALNAADRAQLDAWRARITQADGITSVANVPTLEKALPLATNIGETVGILKQGSPLIVRSEPAGIAALVVGTETSSAAGVVASSIARGDIVSAARAFPAAIAQPFRAAVSTFQGRVADVVEGIARGDFLGAANDNFAGTGPAAPAVSGVAANDNGNDVSPSPAGAVVGNDNMPVSADVTAAQAKVDALRAQRDAMPLAERAASDINQRIAAAQQQANNARIANEAAQTPPGGAGGIVTSAVKTVSDTVSSALRTIAGWMGFSDAVSSAVESSTAPVTDRTIQDRFIAAFNAVRDSAHQLSYNTDLAQAAYAYAQTFATDPTTGRPLHVDVNGSTPATRATNVGYVTVLPATGRTLVEENLAAGYGTDASLTDKDVQDLVSDWMASIEGHRENLLDTRTLDVGVGFSNGRIVAMFGVRDFGGTITAADTARGTGVAPAVSPTSDAAAQIDAPAAPANASTGQSSQPAASQPGSPVSPTDVQQLLQQQQSIQEQLKQLQDSLDQLKAQNPGLNPLQCVQAGAAAAAVGAPCTPAQIVAAQQMLLLQKQIDALTTQSGALDARIQTLAGTQAQPVLSFGAFVQQGVTNVVGPVASRVGDAISSVFGVAPRVAESPGAGAVAVAPTPATGAGVSGTNGSAVGRNVLDTLAGAPDIVTASPGTLAPGSSLFSLLSRGGVGVPTPLDPELEAFFANRSPIFVQALPATAPVTVASIVRSAERAIGAGIIAIPGMRTVADRLGLGGASIALAPQTDGSSGGAAANTGVGEGSTIADTVASQDPTPTELSEVIPALAAQEETQVQPAIDNRTVMRRMSLSSFMGRAMGVFLAFQIGASTYQYTQGNPFLPEWGRTVAYYAIKPYAYQSKFVWAFSDWSNPKATFALRLKYFSEGVSDEVSNLSGLFTGKHILERQALANLNDTKYSLDHLRRLDAWRLYLSMPQKYDTFETSPYAPGISSNAQKTYVRIKGFWTMLLRTYPDMPTDATEADVARRVYNELWVRGVDKRGTLQMDGQDFAADIMGNFTFGASVDDKGRPYISYYDRWDLGGSSEGERGIIGKPYDIYDRYYFDPKTFARIYPERDVATQASPSATAASIAAQSGVSPQTQAILDLAKLLDVADAAGYTDEARALQGKIDAAVVTLRATNPTAAAETERLLATREGKPRSGGAAANPGVGETGGVVGTAALASVQSPAQRAALARIGGVSGLAAGYGFAGIVTGIAQTVRAAVSSPVAFLRFSLALMQAGSSIGSPGAVARSIEQTLLTSPNPIVAVVPGAQASVPTLAQRIAATPIQEARTIDGVARVVVSAVVPELTVPAREENIGNETPAPTKEASLTSTVPAGNATAPVADAERIAAAEAAQRQIQADLVRAKATYETLKRFVDRAGDHSLDQKSERHFASVYNNFVGGEIAATGLSAAFAPYLDVFEQLRGSGRTFVATIDGAKAVFGDNAAQLQTLRTRYADAGSAIQREFTIAKLTRAYWTGSLQSALGSILGHFRSLVQTKKDITSLAMTQAKAVQNTVASLTTKLAAANDELANLREAQRIGAPQMAGMANLGGPRQGTSILQGNLDNVLAANIYNSIIDAWDRRRQFLSGDAQTFAQDQYQKWGAHLATVLAAGHDTIPSSDLKTPGIDVPLTPEPQSTRGMKLVAAYDRVAVAKARGDTGLQTVTAKVNDIRKMSSADRTHVDVRVDVVTNLTLNAVANPGAALQEAEANIAQLGTDGYITQRVLDELAATRAAWSANKMDIATQYAYLGALKRAGEYPYVFDGLGGGKGIAGDPFMRAGSGDASLSAAQNAAIIKPGGDAGVKATVERLTTAMARANGLDVDMSVTAEKAVFEFESSSMKGVPQAARNGVYAGADQRSFAEQGRDLLRWNSEQRPKIQQLADSGDALAAQVLQEVDRGLKEQMGMRDPRDHFVINIISAVTDHLTPLLEMQNTFTKDFYAKEFGVDVSQVSDVRYRAWRNYMASVASEAYQIDSANFGATDAQGNPVINLTGALSIATMDGAQKALTQNGPYITRSGDKRFPVNRLEMILIMAENLYNKNGSGAGVDAGIPSGGTDRTNHYKTAFARLSMPGGTRADTSGLAEAKPAVQGPAASAQQPTTQQPAVKTATPVGKDGFDPSQNNNPVVIQSAVDAARVAAAAGYLRPQDVQPAAALLQGWGRIESRLNPTFIHYTPSGALSQYQGLQQFNWAESVTSLARLKAMQKKIPETSSEYKILGDVIAIAESLPKNTVGKDMRFDARTGMYLFMALHIANPQSANANVLSAILDTYPATKADGVTPQRYDIVWKTIKVTDKKTKKTRDQIIARFEKSDTGFYSATEAHIAAMGGGGQHNPSGLVSNGKINEDKLFTFTDAEFAPNINVFGNWIVKPGEWDKAPSGIRAQNFRPYDIGTVIAYTAINTDARDNSILARDEAFRHVLLGQFLASSQTFSTAAIALQQTPDDKAAQDAYSKAFDETARLGWRIRSTFFDPGKDLDAPGQSTKGAAFRNQLGAFRDTGFTQKPTASNIKDQIQRVQSMNTLVTEQLALVPNTAPVAIAKIPTPAETVMSSMTGGGGYVTPQRIIQAQMNAAQRKAAAAATAAQALAVAMAAVPSEEQLNQIAKEVLSQFGVQNLTGLYTYDVNGIVREKNTGKVVPGFKMLPRADAGTTGRLSAFNTVTGELVVMNEMIRRIVGEDVAFNSGARPFDIGSNRHHSWFKKKGDGSYSMASTGRCNLKEDGCVVVSFALDYYAKDASAKAALVATADKARFVLNRNLPETAILAAPSRGSVSIGARYTDSPDMVHVDQAPKSVASSRGTESRTWGQAPQPTDVQRLLNWIFGGNSGSKSKPSEISHAAFAEALARARLGPVVGGVVQSPRYVAITKTVQSGTVPSVTTIAAINPLRIATTLTGLDAAGVTVDAGTVALAHEPIALDTAAAGLRSWRVASTVIVPGSAAEMLRVMAFQPSSPSMGGEFKLAFGIGSVRSAQTAGASPSIPPTAAPAAVAAVDQTFTGIPGITGENKAMRVVVPTGGTPTRAVVYLHGQNTGDYAGFDAKVNAIKDQLPSGTMLIALSLGDQVEAKGGQVPSLNGTVAAIGTTLHDRLGIDFAQMPVVLVGYSGGGAVARDLLQKGDVDAHLTMAGGGVVILGGLYGSDSGAWSAWLRQHPDVPFIATYTGTSDALQAQNLARSLGISIGSAAPTTLASGARVIYQTSGMHAELPKSVFGTLVAVMPSASSGAPASVAPTKMAALTPVAAEKTNTNAIALGTVSPLVAAQIRATQDSGPVGDASAAGVRVPHWADEPMNGRVAAAKADHGDGGQYGGTVLAVFAPDADTLQLQVHDDMTVDEMAAVADRCRAAGGTCVIGGYVEGQKTTRGGESSDPSATRGVSVDDRIAHLAQKLRALRARGYAVASTIEIDGINTYVADDAPKGSLAKGQRLVSLAHAVGFTLLDAKNISLAQAAQMMKGTGMAVRGYAFEDTVGNIIPTSAQRTQFKAETSADIPALTQDTSPRNPDFLAHALEAAKSGTPVYVSMSAHNYISYQEAYTVAERFAAFPNVMIVYTDAIGRVVDLRRAIAAKAITLAAGEAAMPKTGAPAPTRVASLGDQPVQTVPAPADTGAGSSAGAADIGGLPVKISIGPWKQSTASLYGYTGDNAGSRVLATGAIRDNALFSVARKLGDASLPYGAIVEIQLVNHDTEEPYGPHVFAVVNNQGTLRPGRALDMLPSVAEGLGLKGDADAGVPSVRYRVVALPATPYKYQVGPSERPGGTVTVGRQDYYRGLTREQQTRVAGVVDASDARVAGIGSPEQISAALAQQMATAAVRARVDETLDRVMNMWQRPVWLARISVAYRASAEAQQRAAVALRDAGTAGSVDVPTGTTPGETIAAGTEELPSVTGQEGAVPPTMFERIISTLAGLRNRVADAYGSVIAGLRIDVTRPAVQQPTTPSPTRPAASNVALRPDEIGTETYVPGSVSDAGPVPTPDDLRMLVERIKGTAQDGAFDPAWNPYIAALEANVAELRLPVTVDQDVMTARWQRAREAMDAALVALGERALGIAKTEPVPSESSTPVAETVPPVQGATTPVAQQPSAPVAIAAAQPAGPVINTQGEIVPVWAPSNPGGLIATARAIAAPVRGYAATVLARWSANQAAVDAAQNAPVSFAELVAGMRDAAVAVPTDAERAPSVGLVSRIAALWSAAREIASTAGEARLNTPNTEPVNPMPTPANAAAADVAPPASGETGQGKLADSGFDTGLIASVVLDDAVLVRPLELILHSRDMAVARAWYSGHELTDGQADAVAALMVPALVENSPRGFDANLGMDNYVSDTDRAVVERNRTRIVAALARLGYATPAETRVAADANAVTPEPVEGVRAPVQNPDRTVSVIDGVASEVPSTPSASVSSGTDLNTTLLTPDEVGLYVSNLAARDRGELAPLVREFAAMDASGAVAQDARIRFVNLFNIAGTARFHDTSATPDRFAISPLGARTIAATIDATRAAVYRQNADELDALIADLEAKQRQPAPAVAVTAPATPSASTGDVSANMIAGMSQAGQTPAPEAAATPASGMSVASRVGRFVWDAIPLDMPGQSFLYKVPVVGKLALVGAAQQKLVSAPVVLLAAWIGGPGLGISGTTAMLATTFAHAFIMHPLNRFDDVRALATAFTRFDRWVRGVSEPAAPIGTTGAATVLVAPSPADARTLAAAREVRDGINAVLGAYRDEQARGSGVRGLAARAVSWVRGVLPTNVIPPPGAGGDGGGDTTKTRWLVRLAVLVGLSQLVGSDTQTPPQTDTQPKPVVAQGGPSAVNGGAAAPGITVQPGTKTTPPTGGAVPTTPPASSGQAAPATPPAGQTVPATPGQQPPATGEKAPQQSSPGMTCKNGVCTDIPPAPPGGGQGGTDTVPPAAGGTERGVGGTGGTDGAGGTGGDRGLGGRGGVGGTRGSGGAGGMGGSGSSGVASGGNSIGSNLGALGGLLGSVAGIMRAMNAPCQNVPNTSFPSMLWQPQTYNPMLPCPAQAQAPQSGTPIATVPTSYPIATITPPKPVIQFVVNPAEIAAQHAPIVSWVSVNTDGCAVYGPTGLLTPRRTASGTIKNLVISRSSEFALVCAQADGTVMDPMRKVVRVTGDSGDVQKAVLTALPPKAAAPQRASISNTSSAPSTPNDVQTQANAPVNTGVGGGSVPVQSCAPRMDSSGFVDQRYIDCLYQNGF